MAATDPGSTFLKSLSCFGPRSRELTGAEDLVAHYGLQDLYEQFCRKPLSVSIADSLYLQHVVGDIEIRKGESMEFGQLIANPSNTSVNIQPLDLQLLQLAFSLKESGTIALLEADKGVQTVSGNLKVARDQKKKKKHKKDKKHKHRDKDKVRKDKDKGHGIGEIDEDRSKKHRKKKRRLEEGGEEADGHKPKKKKVTSS